MIIQKLDGFTADGYGNVIGTAADLVDGDVQRITIDKDVTEQRFYAPAPAAPPPDFDYPTDTEILLARLDLMDAKLNELAAR